MNLLKHILLTITTFFIPIQGILILLVAIVSVDTIMAIYVSIKLSGIKSFRSSLLRKGMTAKIFLYLGTVMLMYAIDNFIMGGSLFGIQYLFAKGLASVWIFGELKSMDENSIKLGNRSFAIIFKDFFKNITGYKNDIKKMIE